MMTQDRSTGQPMAAPTTVPDSASMTELQSPEAPQISPRNLNPAAPAFHQSAPASPKNLNPSAPVFRQSQPSGERLTADPLDGAFYAGPGKVSNDDGGGDYVADAVSPQMPNGGIEGLSLEDGTCVAAGEGGSSVDGVAGQKTDEPQLEQQEVQQQVHASGSVDIVQAIAKYPDELLAPVTKQMHYYFSNENLPNDKFLNGRMDSDKYIPLEIFLDFGRMKPICSSVDMLRQAIEVSPTLELNETKDRVRVSQCRKTLTLRGFPGSPLVSEEEVKQFVLDMGGEQPTHIQLVMVKDKLSTWYVSFRDMNAASEAFFNFHNKQAVFKGYGIGCCMKSSGTLGGTSYYPPLQAGTPQTGAPVVAEEIVQHHHHHLGSHAAQRRGLVVPAQQASVISTVSASPVPVSAHAVPSTPSPLPAQGGQAHHQHQQQQQHHQQQQAAASAAAAAAAAALLPQYQLHPSFISGSPAGIYYQQTSPSYMQYIPSMLAAAQGWPGAAAAMDPGILMQNNGLQPQQIRSTPMSRPHVMSGGGGGPNRYNNRPQRGMNRPNNTGMDRSGGNDRSNDRSVVSVPNLNSGARSSPSSAPGYMHHGQHHHHHHQNNHHQQQQHRSGGGNSVRDDIASAVMSVAAVSQVQQQQQQQHHQLQQFVPPLVNQHQLTQQQQQGHTTTAGSVDVPQYQHHHNSSSAGNAQAILAQVTAAAAAAAASTALSSSSNIPAVQQPSILPPHATTSGNNTSSGAGSNNIVPVTQQMQQQHQHHHNPPPHQHNQHHPHHHHHQPPPPLPHQQNHQPPQPSSHQANHHNQPQHHHHNQNQQHHHHHNQHHQHQPPPLQHSQPPPPPPHHHSQHHHHHQGQHSHHQNHHHQQQHSMLQQPPPNHHPQNHQQIPPPQQPPPHHHQHHHNQQPHHQAPPPGRRDDRKKGRRREDTVRNPRGNERTQSNRANFSSQVPPAAADNFTMEANSFPPLPGAANNVANSEVSHENRMSDVVRGLGRVPGGPVGTQAVGVGPRGPSSTPSPVATPNPTAVTQHQRGPTNQVQQQQTDSDTSGAVDDVVDTASSQDDTDNDPPVDVGHTVTPAPSVPSTRSEVNHQSHGDAQVHTATNRSQKVPAASGSSTRPSESRQGSTPSSLSTGISGNKQGTSRGSQPPVAQSPLTSPTSSVPVVEAPKLSYAQIAQKSREAANNAAAAAAAVNTTDTTVSSSGIAQASSQASMVSNSSSSYSSSATASNNGPVQNGPSSGTGHHNHSHHNHQQNHQSSGGNVSSNSIRNNSNNNGSNAGSASYGSSQNHTGYHGGRGGDQGGYRQQRGRGGPGGSSGYQGGSSQYNQRMGNNSGGENNRRNERQESRKYEKSVPSGANTKYEHRNPRKPEARQK